MEFLIRRIFFPPKADPPLAEGEIGGEVKTVKLLLFAVKKYPLIAF